MLVYGIAKFIGYTFYSWLGMWITRDATRDGPPSFGKALGWGTLRWLLGLGIGFVLFFAIQVGSSDAVWRTYLAVYTPVRVFEWGVIALLLHASRPSDSYRASMPAWLGWIAGGIALSFATDMLSPEAVQGRFCVGRCLC